MNNKGLIIIFGIFVGGFFVGFFLNYKIKNRLLGNLVEKRLIENYQFINPLLDCDENISSFKSMSAIKTTVKSYIDEQINTKKVTKIAVYYRDMNNGPWFDIDGVALFSPASLVKVPLMIAYLKLAEGNDELLNQELKNNLPDDYASQNFIPEKKLEFNKSYTVNDLIERMIIYSDNSAYIILKNNIEIEKLVAIYRDLDVDVSMGSVDPNGNIISVKDYASFFRILYNSSYLNRNMSEKALKILSQSTFNKGLVSLLPKNIVVSHKFGERLYTATKEEQLHDCGIVYKKNYPYLICIMVKGYDFNNLSTAISQISNMVYNYDFN